MERVERTERAEGTERTERAERAEAKITAKVQMDLERNRGKNQPSV